MVVRRSVILIALAVWATGCASSQAAAPDPCSFLGRAQVAQLLGGAVKSGTPSGTGHTCYYAPLKVSAGPSLLLTVQSGDTSAAFAEAERNAIASGGTISPLSGIGEEAFVFTAGDSSTVSAEARKGTTRIRVLVRGSGASSARAALASLVVVATR